MNSPAARALSPSGAMPSVRHIAKRSNAMFVFLFTAWGGALAWFGPRLIDSMSAAEGPVSQFAQGYFVVFVCVAWLYGLYNISVVVFATIARFKKLPGVQAVTEPANTAVAVLYTTCNDFVQAGAESCARLEYANYTVYILDDSSDSTIRRRIDRFAKRFDHVHVVRRPDRKGFKAGNLNHALQHHVSEPFFVIADSDEILPRIF